MSLLQASRRLFSLDTLDHRFTASSKARLQDLANKDGNKTNNAPSGSHPSLWRTPEFSLYYLVFAVVVPLMFKAVYDVSKPSHPNFSNYEHLLSPGWIPGRKVDNSDAQYSGFRDKIPYMLVLIVLHPTLRRLYNTFFSTAATTDDPVPGSATGILLADARLKQRVTYDLLFALVYLSLLHGFSTLKILLILYINYSLATKLPRHLVVPVTWIFNIGILFANELCEGYPYQSIANALAVGQSKELNNWGTILDRYGGLVPRWEIRFNFTLLRLISFNMDNHWSLTQPASIVLEKKQLDPSDLTERERVNISARREDYTFRNYLAYLLYAPLYMTGPILTFNEYISQVRHAPKSVNSTRTLLYGVRFLISLLVMELLLHFIYAVAISKAKPAWEVYSPFQVSMLGYFNLHIIWLKLLLPWRFFRLWSLVDGIDPPENMVRCMSNNYSAFAFWRGWHRSFNRWTIRYIYIPLGGSGRPGSEGKLGAVRKIVNFLAVFTFVALWHDLSLTLLMWGWLVTLFIVPEALATLAFPKRQWQNRHTAYRVICGIGAVGNILMMMAANLVGFAIGIDGLQGMVYGIVGTKLGILFLAAACGALFVGAQVMFELREEEIRNGFRMTC